MCVCVCVCASRQSADLELALARCGVFCSYWVLAGQALGAGQRGAVEAAVRDAALAAELPMALPLGGSLAAWLVAPRRGNWVPWAATLPSVATDRPGAVISAANLMPAPAMAAASGGAADGADERLAALCAPPAFHYFRDVRGGAGCLALFVPSAASQALEYATQLALQAGLQPVLLGPPGSGRRTLLAHLLATVPMHQLQTLVAVAPAGAGGGAAGGFSPAALQAALMWHLAPGAAASLRPAPGHRLVVVVEDLNAAAVGGAGEGRHAGELAAAAQEVGGGAAAAVVAAGGAAAAGLGAPGAAAAGCEVEVPSPGLEWLRQVLDTRSVRDAASGVKLAVRGTSFAFTSTPHALLNGTDQVSGRLWRHMLQLHIDAAARSGDAGFATVPVAGPAAVPPALGPGGGLVSIFSRPAVSLALAQHTLAHLVTCGVTEAMAMPLPPAAAVLAATLEAVSRDVAALTASGLTPSLWHFDTAAMRGVVKRLCAAVAVANGLTHGLLPQLTASGATAGVAAVPLMGGPNLMAGDAGRHTQASQRWSLRDVVQRLAFEVGRAVMGHVPVAAGREALAKVLVGTLGRHLGPLMSGRLEAALAAARDVLYAPPPVPATILSSSPTKDAGAAAAAAAAAVVDTWSGFVGRKPSDLTTLRISLAGRMPPREISALLAALLGSLPPHDDPTAADEADGGNALLAALVWPAAAGGPGGGGGGALRSGLAGNSRRLSGSGALALLPAASIGGAAGAGGENGAAAGAAAAGAGNGGYGPAPGAATWLVHRPLSLPDLAQLVRALLAERSEQAQHHHHARPRSQPDAAAAMSASGAAPPTTTPAGTAAAAASTGTGASAASLPQCNLGPLALALLEDAGEHWGYGEMVRPAAAALFEGYFSGGHVAIVGANTHMCEEAACLAALAAGAHLTRLDRPLPPRSNGSAPGHRPAEYALRGALAARLQQVVAAMAAGGAAAGSVRPYSQAMAVAAGGFSAPGVPFIGPGPTDPSTLVATRSAAAATLPGVGGVSMPGAGGTASGGVGTGTEAGGGVWAAGDVRPATRDRPKPVSGLHVILLTDGMLQVSLVVWWWVVFVPHKYGDTSRRAYRPPCGHANAPFTPTNIQQHTRVPMCPCPPPARRTTPPWSCCRRCCCGPPRCPTWCASWRRAPACPTSRVWSRRSSTPTCPRWLRPAPGWPHPWTEPAAARPAAAWRPTAPRPPSRWRAGWPRAGAS